MPHSAPLVSNPAAEFFDLTPTDVAEFIPPGKQTEPDLTAADEAEDPQPKPIYSVTKIRGASVDGESCGVETIFTLLILAWEMDVKVIPSLNLASLRKWITLVLAGYVNTGFGTYMLDTDPDPAASKYVEELWRSADKTEDAILWVEHSDGLEKIILLYSHLKRLIPNRGVKSWLDDEIVNASILLAKKKEKFNQPVFNSFFAVKAKQSAADLCRWVRTERSRATKAIEDPVGLIVPVNIQDEHWVVLHVLPATQSCVVYGADEDDIAGSSQALDSIVLSVTQGIHKLDLGKSPQLSEYEKQSEKQSPQLSEYEMKRLVTIKANQAMLAALAGNNVSSLYGMTLEGTTVDTKDAGPGSESDPEYVPSDVPSASDTDHDTEDCSSNKGEEGGGTGRGKAAEQAVVGAMLPPLPVPPLSDSPLSGSAAPPPRLPVQLSDSPLSGSAAPPPLVVRNVQDALQDAKESYQEVGLMRPRVTASFKAKLADPAFVTLLSVAYKASMNPNAGNDEAANAQAYIETMSCIGTYGGELEIAEIAFLKNAPVMIVEVIGDHLRLSNHFNQTASSAPYILMLSNAGTMSAHYDVLAPSVDFQGVENGKGLLEALFSLVTVHPTRIDASLHAGGLVLAESFYAFGMPGLGNCLFECADLLGKATARVADMNPVGLLEVTRLLPKLNAHGKSLAKEITSTLVKAKPVADLVWSGTHVYDETRVFAAFKLATLLQLLNCRGPSMDVGHGLGNVQLAFSSAFKNPSVGIEANPRIHVMAKKCVILTGSTAPVAFRCINATDMPTFQGLDVVHLYECMKGLLDGPNTEHKALIRNLLNTDGLVAFTSTKLSSKLLHKYAESEPTIRDKLAGLVCVHLDGVARKGQCPVTHVFIRKDAFFRSNGQRAVVPRAVPGSVVCELLAATSKRALGFLHKLTKDLLSNLQSRTMTGFPVHNNNAVLFFGPIGVHCYLTGIKVVHGETLQMFGGATTTRGTLVGAGNYQKVEIAEEDKEPESEKTAALIILKLDGGGFEIFNQVDLLQIEQNIPRTVVTQEDLDAAYKYFKAEKKKSKPGYDTLRGSSERIQQLQIKQNAENLAKASKQAVEAQAENLARATKQAAKIEADAAELAAATERKQKALERKEHKADLQRTRRRATPSSRRSSSDGRATPSSRASSSDDPKHQEWSDDDGSNRRLLKADLDFLQQQITDQAAAARKVADKQMSDQAAAAQDVAKKHISDQAAAAHAAQQVATDALKSRLAAQQKQNENHQASFANITSQLIALTSSTQQQAAASVVLQTKVDLSVCARVAKDKADKATRKEREKQQETKETTRRACAFEASMQGKMDNILKNFTIEASLAALKAQVEETNTRAKEDTVVRLKLEATIAKQELDALRLQNAAERKQNGGHETYSRWLLLLTQCLVDPNCITQERAGAIERAVAIHT